jgi:hypothetical protein
MEVVNDSGGQWMIETTVDSKENDEQMRKMVGSENGGRGTVSYIVS